jgi:tRNA A-37 threonylcarbamoyl transferase component Bud32
MPTDARIGAAKRAAVGGKRKRCTKGKNCSAACIAANMVCLVDLPWVGPALGQAREFIMSRRQGEGGKSERVMRWTDRKGAPAPAPVPKAPEDYKSLGTRNLERGIQLVDSQLEENPSPALKKIKKDLTTAAKELQGEVQVAPAKAPAKEQKAPLQGPEKWAADAKKEAEGLKDSELLRDLKAARNPIYKNAYQAEADRRGLQVPTTEAAPAPRAGAAKAPAEKEQNEKFKNAVKDLNTTVLRDLVNMGDEALPGSMLGIAKEELAKRGISSGSKAPAPEPQVKVVPRNPQSQRNKGQSFYEDDGSYNPREQFNLRGRILGEGMFGKAKKIIKNGDVVKDGQIGQYEAAALKLLEDTGVAPKLRGVMYNSSAAPKTVGPGYGGHVRERKGFLGMEGAKGDRLGDQWYGMNRAEKDKVVDLYIQARAKIHRKGVAHNDMHGNNVYYDPKTGRMTLIDFGLAQINPKAALVEALGAMTGKDWQADRWRVKNFDTPVAQRLRQNTDDVLGILKNKYGVDAADLPKIRASEDSLNKLFGKMTNAEAQSLVNQVYKDIRTPSQGSASAGGTTAKAPTKAPAAKVATAKVPAAKPAPNTRERFIEDLKKKPTKELEDFYQKYKGKIKPEIEKMHKDELKRRGALPESSAPKAPSAKPASAKPVAKSAPKPPAKAPSAKPPAKAPTKEPKAKTPIPLNTFAKDVKDVDTADLRAAARNPSFKTTEREQINREIERREQLRAAKPETRSTGNSFYNSPSRAKFDFSAEGKKPGISEISVGGNAQAEDVKINRANDVIMKKGKIGQFEAAALERLKDEGIVPALKGVKYNASGVPQTVERGVGAHLKEKAGQLAMGLAPGEAAYLQLGDRAVARDIGNKGMLARKAMHLRDVAHNDMHGGNVYYDPKTGKLTLIDMGLAQISPKAALVEAMGGALGQDYQGEWLVKKANKSTQDKLRNNANKVYDKLMDKGYNMGEMPEIRTPLAQLDRFFKGMTDDEARQLVKEVYDGID